MVGDPVGGEDDDGALGVVLAGMDAVRVGPHAAVRERARASAVPGAVIVMPSGVRYVVQRDGSWRRQ